MRCVDEAYYGSKNENDSSNYFKWMDTIKNDFNIFIKYLLCDKSKKLKEKLEIVSNCIGEEYDFGIQENSRCRMRMNGNYLVFDCPLYNEEDEIYYFNVVIISRDYKSFYFIDTIDGYCHNVEFFSINGDDVQNLVFHIKAIYNYFNDESLNNFLEDSKKYALNQ